MNNLAQMSGDARLREAARLREKRLHDEASELASAREEGKLEGKIEGKHETLIELFKEGNLSLLLIQGWFTNLLKYEHFRKYKAEIEESRGAEKVDVRWTSGIAEPSEQMK